MELLWEAACQPLTADQEAEGWISSLQVPGVSDLLRSRNLHTLRGTANMTGWLKQHFPVLIQDRRLRNPTQTLFAIFPYSNVSDYAAVCAWDVLKDQGTLPYSELQDQLLQTKYISPAMLKEAFKRYPQSLLQTNEGCMASGKRISPPMIEKCRDTLSDLIQRLLAAEPDRTLFISRIPSEFPFVKLFYKGNLATWLTTTFPDFILTKKNNADAICSWDDILDQIRQALNAKLGAFRNAWMDGSDVLAFIDEKWPDCSSIAHSIPLPQLLVELCSGVSFILDENGNLSVPLESNYPPLPMRRLVDAEAEKNVTLGMCYINAASFLKTLSAMGYGKSLPRWVEQFSYRFIRALSGVGEYHFLDDMIGKGDCAVFNTGLFDASGNEFYAVLVKKWRRKRTTLSVDLDRLSRPG